MTIRVDVFTTRGTARGVVTGATHLRDLLEGRPEITLTDTRWRPFDAMTDHAVRDLILPIDDVLVAVGDDDPNLPVHASWHPVRLEMGPYLVEGELPTLPGYDPGRALARPTGEFVLLRDVRLGWIGRPDPSVPIGDRAYVNRYGVDRVSCDIMLGFFFPGAALDGTAIAAT
jgi:hypothetical protein